MGERWSGTAASLFPRLKVDLCWVGSVWASSIGANSCELVIPSWAAAHLISCYAAVMEYEDAGPLCLNDQKSVLLPPEAPLPPPAAPSHLPARCCSLCDKLRYRSSSPGIHRHAALRLSRICLWFPVGWHPAHMSSASCRARWGCSDWRRDWCKSDPWWRKSAGFCSHQIKQSQSKSTQESVWAFNCF